MQSGSYKVTARPASTTRCCTDRQTTDQQPGHPNRGVSRKQESGHLPVADILTVVGVADRAGGAGGFVPAPTLLRVGERLTPEAAATLVSRCAKFTDRGPKPGGWSTSTTPAGCACRHRS
jgi:hypothetical protein